jgi:hypothetical protein
MRTGATLALLAWRELDRNDWIGAIRSAVAAGRQLPVPPPDAPSPFSLADPSRVEAILGAAGFGGIELEPVDAPMVLGTDAEDAFAFTRTMGIVQWLTHDLDPAARAAAFDELQATMRAHETAAGVSFASSAWLISAHRTGR